MICGVLDIGAVIAGAVTGLILVAVVGATIYAWWRTPKE